MSTHDSLTDCKAHCINMFMLHYGAYMLGHPLHFPLVKSDKFRF